MQQKILKLRTWICVGSQVAQLPWSRTTGMALGTRWVVPFLYVVSGRLATLIAGLLADRCQSLWLVRSGGSPLGQWVCPRARTSRHTELALHWQGIAFMLSKTGILKYEFRPWGSTGDRDFRNTSTRSLK